MSTVMIYYLAWQEDDWLDELLDRFPQVNALVPTAKTFAQLQEQRAHLDRVVLVLNAAQEQEKCQEFLEWLERDERLSADPVYIVGLKPDEEQEWQNRFPRARIIVITGFAVEFDYESVLDRMEEDLEGAR